MKCKKYEGKEGGLTIYTCRGLHSKTHQGATAPTANWLRLLT